MSLFPPLLLHLALGLRLHLLLEDHGVPGLGPGHGVDDPPVLAHLSLQSGQNSPLQLIISLHLLDALVVVCVGVGQTAVEVAVAGAYLLVVVPGVAALLHDLLIVCQAVRDQIWTSHSVRVNILST